MSLPRHGRGDGGFGLRELALLLSILCVTAALAWPTVSSALFEARVDAVASDIETVQEAAGRHLRERGVWPAGDAPGRVPETLRAFLLDPVPFQGAERGLQWHRWAVVEPAGDGAGTDAEGDTLPRPAPAVYRLAAISVHSGRTDLLAALLGRYGPTRSFVRDTTWTLVLPWQEEPRADPSLSPPASP